VIFPKGAIIRTILKDVPPEALGAGATLFHDHLSMSSPRPYAKPSATPAPPQWLENVDAVVEEVKAAAKDGVSCIVTGGTRDLGQKPANVRTIAEQVAPAGEHIVLSDALWTQPAYPPDIPTKSESQLTDEFLRRCDGATVGSPWGAWQLDGDALRRTQSVSRHRKGPRSHGPADLHPYSARGL
jgi:predicted metal-dependent phosphotriesterase family hydrolase